MIERFSINSIAVAAVTVIIMLLSNFSFWIGAKIHDVRIEKFEIFSPLGGKSLLQFKKGHTVFSLGLYPWNSSIKIAGMLEEELLDPEHEIKDYMLISKPKSVGFQFLAIFILISLIGTLISLYFMDTAASLAENMVINMNYIKSLFSYLTYNIDAMEFQEKWLELSENKNTLAFMFSVAFPMTMLMNLPGHIVGFLRKASITVFIIFLVSCLYLMYKVIILIIVLNSWLSILSISIDYLLSSYIFAFIIMITIKYIPSNKTV